MHYIDILLVTVGWNMHFENPIGYDSGCGFHIRGCEEGEVWDTSFYGRCEETQGNWQWQEKIEVEKCI